MELTKSKYKQSEVGLIPEDWDSLELNELGATGRPVIKAGPFGSSLKKEYYVSEGYKIYGQEQVIKNDAFYGDYFINQERYRKLKSCEVLPEDILLSLVGTFGKVLLVPNNALKGIINPRLLRISVDKTKFHTKYISHFLKSKKALDILESKLQGGTMGVLNAGILKSFQIPLPPTIIEQKAIATALSDVDELIANLDKLITKKKAIKQGAMQQLLTPPHKVGQRSASIARDWVEKTLGELFDFKTTSTKKQFFDLSGNLIVMDMGSVSIDGKILRSKKASCDFDILKKGDLVMPKDDIGGGNIIGKVAYIDKDNSYVLSDHVFRLNSINDKINSLYFYYLINSRIVNESILKVVSGSAQLGLGLNTIKKITVCYNSDKSQQIAIAQILSDMDL